MKKVCKNCKRLLAEEQECPVCKSTQFGTSWQGRVTIIDAEKSTIAAKMGLKEAGEYAIKTR